MERWESLLCFVSGIGLVAMSSPTGRLAVEMSQLRLDLGSETDDNLADQYRGAVRDANRHVHVLDARHGVIVSLDQNGRRLFTTGVRGSGRGQAGVPRRLHDTPEGHLLLVDEATAKIVEFAPGPTELRVVREVSVPFHITDACVLGGRTFVLGLHSGHAVQEVDGAGVVRLSFGDPQGPAQGFARERLTTGMLQCSEVDSSIVVAFTREPIVEAYSTAGNLRWKTRIAGARGVDVDASSANSITYRVPADGADVLSYLGSLNRWHVVVQTRRLLGGEKRSQGRPGTTTTSLDLRDGKEDVRGEGLPVILGGTAADVFAFGDAAPFGVNVARLVVKQRNE